MKIQDIEISIKATDNLSEKVKKIQNFLRIDNIRSWVNFTRRSLEDPAYSNKERSYCPTCGGVNNMIHHPDNCLCEPEIVY